MALFSYENLFFENYQIGGHLLGFQTMWIMTTRGAYHSTVIMFPTVLASSLDFQWPYCGTLPVLLSAWEQLAFVRVLSKNIIQYLIFLWKSSKTRKQEFEIQNFDAHFENTLTNAYLPSQ